MDRNGNNGSYRNSEKKRKSSSAPYSRREDTHSDENDKRAYSRKRTVSDSDEEFYKSDSMFFRNSSVNGDVDLRTDRADDFFENKNYTPWEKDDEFNRSNSNSSSESNKAYDKDTRIRRRKKEKTSVGKSLKKKVDKVSEKVFSGGEDEDTPDDYEHIGIAEGIKNKRRNRQLLDELQGNKKPLTKGQRKLKNILMTGGIVAVVLAIVITLSLTVLFKCEKIVIEGTTRYSADDIINVSNIKYGENIFIANKSSAKKRIEAQYPYIENAKIGFSVPDTITIKVTEAVPEYYIQEGTRFYIISKNSKILEQVVKRDFDIPNIVGCKLKSPKVGQKTNIENSKVMTVIKEIALSIDKNRVTGIKEINVSDMSDIELNYDNRIKIVIGMPEYVDYKIRTAMTIIMQKLSQDDKGRLNCSNLVEGRTDNKDNASYFQPDRIVATEAETQPPSQVYEQPPTEYYTEAPTEAETEPQQIEEEQPYYVEENPAPADDTLPTESTAAGDDAEAKIYEIIRNEIVE